MRYRLEAYATLLSGLAREVLIRSIVPLGRVNFPDDSRHFVPGYYHAVPRDKNHSPIEAPRNK
jgi:hypothetical protein